MAIFFVACWSGADAAPRAWMPTRPTPNTTPSRSACAMAVAGMVFLREGAAGRKKNEDGMGRDSIGSEKQDGMGKEQAESVEDSERKIGDESMKVDGEKRVRADVDFEAGATASTRGPSSGATSRGRGTSTSGVRTIFLREGAAMASGSSEIAPGTTSAKSSSTWPASLSG